MPSMGLGREEARNKGVLEGKKEERKNHRADRENAGYPVKFEFQINNE